MLWRRRRLPGGARSRDPQRFRYTFNAAALSTQEFLIFQIPTRAAAAAAAAAPPRDPQPPQLRSAAGPIVTQPDVGGASAPAPPPGRARRPGSPGCTGAAGGRAPCPSGWVGRVASGRSPLLGLLGSLPPSLRSSCTAASVPHFWSSQPRCG
ncbi:uncharacterized protein [Symphalangus syndactylus]|uniref:uncharacterized protein n=1 Tax=Symphalangus syndactylus TaxID=9590 RepID=UPI003006BB84